MSRYRVIAVEGFDGTGKSTIAKWISENLNYEYHKSPSGLFHQARELFDSASAPVSDRLAFYLGDCIRISSMLQERSDTSFVLDRYYYSTVAYHEAAFPNSTKYARELIKTLYKPDLVIVLRSTYKRSEKESTNEVFCFLMIHYFLIIKLSSGYMINTKC